MTINQMYMNSSLYIVHLISIENQLLNLNKLIKLSSIEMSCPKHNTKRASFHHNSVIGGTRITSASQSFRSRFLRILHISISHRNDTHTQWLWGRITYESYDDDSKPPISHANVHAIFM